MSRTDKDRPYEVRRLDPTEKMRYWSAAHLPSGNRFYRESRWELDILPFNRPPRWHRREAWSKMRNREQIWSVKARFDHEAEAPDGRARHSMMWWWD
jgi:hypothetical protein